MTQAETHLTQAETHLTHTENNLTQAETHLTHTENNLTHTGNHLTQAEINWTETGIYTTYLAGNPTKIDKNKKPLAITLAITPAHFASGFEILYVPAYHSIAKDIASQLMLAI